jgi:UDP-N-acetylmuramate dehydrogenase
VTEWKERLVEALGESVRLDEPLADKVAFRIGGPAEAFVRPVTAEELAIALRLADALDVPVTMLGSGSNVLISDEGIAGMTIRLSGQLADVAVQPDGVGDKHRVWVGAGALNARVVSRMLDESLVDVEFLATIPGTFGGALIMNAGAHGGEIGPFVEQVRLLRPDRSEEARAGTDCGFRYRSSGFARGEILLGATLLVARGDAKAARAHLRQMRAHRRETQPIGEPNAGSIFKNPPGDFAGRLIEACGLKGTSEGRARVSELHANFIVNSGGATAADVCALARRLQEAVLKRFEVPLEWEVKRIGRGFEAVSGSDRSIGS